MKISALIPYWLDDQLDELDYNKTLKKLGGKYLINYSIELLNSIPQIDETVIYCSNQKINKYINQGLDYKFIERDKSLDNENILVDDIIEAFVKTTNAEIIILLHPHSPFLNSSTLLECLDKVMSKEYSSSFTAYEFKKLAWYKGKPLNYALNKGTPKLKTLEPIVIEQSSLYIFSIENNKIIKNNPYIKVINHFEGLDVQSKEDFEIAELIVNSGMYPKV